ncbi:aldo/keto reductase [Candidatus Berkiella aquae]|uniref:Aldo/keto reductase n=2 Tax=Candidatus Berkiella aquae TaxID=295108 RepID=A0AAE3HVX6_9GAMM|nr:aldo/keto reductase [Candidatus Berkiella aquae]MCS5710645.1 aldo/keto reductase [Candidatus Berkiella aquae]
MSNGIKMPSLIYGTAWKKEQTAGLVVKAIKNGFRGIDTACQPKHYFEPGVGQALKDLELMGITREQLFLQTKFTAIQGQDPQNIPYDPSVPLHEQVMQSFATSKENLGTEVIDSYILHSPLSTHHDTIQVWRAMEAIYESGSVKQLGISNCYDIESMQRLYQDAVVKPAVLQNRFYKETDYDKELRQWCTENKIVYQSFWTLTANPALLQSSTITAMATANNKTPAQILFRYLTQIGIVPLTGTTSDSHMVEDLAIFSFELTDAEMAKIHHLI